MLLAIKPNFNVLKFWVFKHLSLLLQMGVFGIKGV